VVDWWYSVVVGIVERSILQLCYGFGGQLRHVLFYNSFRKKYELRNGLFHKCAWGGLSLVRNELRNDPFRNSNFLQNELRNGVFRNCPQDP